MNSGEPRNKKKKRQRKTREAKNAGVAQKKRFKSYARRHIVAHMIRGRKDHKPFLAYLSCQPKIASIHSQQPASTMTATTLAQQPQPSRDGSKRQIMATLSSDSSTTIPSDKEWFQTIQHELEQKISALHDDCASEKSKQHDVFTAAMVKLPRNVRNMTVSEFNCVYKVNLLEHLQNPNLSAPAMAKNKMLQTPGATYNAPNYGVTPSRIARKGEILMYVGNSLLLD